MTNALTSLSLEQLLLKLKDEGLGEQECSVIMQCLPEKVSAVMNNKHLTNEEKGRIILNLQQALDEQKKKFEHERKEAQKALTKLNTGKKTIRNYQDIGSE